MTGSATRLSGLVFFCSLLGVSADTTVHHGTISQISSAADLDLSGNFLYAVNFSNNDPVRTVSGLDFTPDNQNIPGASFVGPNQVTPWSTRPEFSNTPDDNALEDILHDIRWASPVAGQQLEAHLPVTPGIEYKLQILISGNRIETRNWDIRVDGLDVVDELSSLGATPGASYAGNRSTLYTYQFVAPDGTTDIVMGDLFGSNSGGDRNPIWQALTLEEVTIPPTPDSIALDPSAFFVELGSIIGRCTTTDRKPGASHNCQLVAGSGDTDNDKFTLSSNILRKGAYDFGMDPPGDYSVRIRSTDTSAPERFLEQVFTVTRLEALAPTGISFSADSISREAAVGRLAGNLLTQDPNAFDRHRYTLVSGPGDQDNALFSTGQNELFVAAAIPTNAVQLSFRIRSTDLVGLFTEASFTLDVLEPSLRISEYMASNGGSLLDEDGAASDWIEIYNELGQIADLSGWYLTDNPDDLTRWRFPDINLGTNGYLVVFASGKDRSGNELHTNFQLSSEGEFLALVKPDGTTIADQYGGVPAFPDVSYGDDASASQRGYQQAPSPGAPNGAVHLLARSEVSFSHERGYYTNAFSLVLTASLPGASIRYSSDGSDPAIGGIAYNGPIPITPETAGTRRGTRRIRAVAQHPDAAFHPVATHTYLFIDGLNDPAGDGIVGQSVFQTSITGNPAYGPLLGDSLRSLPVISVVKPGNVTATESETSVEFFTPDGTEPGFQINCGIKLVGGHSVSSPKNNWRLFFRGEYGTPRLEYPLFEKHAYGKGTEAFDVLQLHSGSHDTFFWLGNAQNPNVANRHGDAQFIRNRWMNDMHLLMGHEAVGHGRFAHLYYNGVYHGFYQIIERPTQHFHAAYLGGKASDHHYTNSGRVGSDHGGGDTWLAVWNAVRASAANWEQAQALIDLGNLADYMLLNFYAGNSWDWTSTHNWMAGGPTEAGRGGWKFHCWDSDIILQDVGNNNLSRGAPHGLFDSLMNQQPDFRVLFRDRAYQLLFHGGLLSPGGPTPFYDFRMNEIRDAVVAESARWQPSNALNPPWDREDEWQNEWDYMRDVFFEQRPAILLDQFRAKGWWPVEVPDFNQRGGLVSNGFEVVLSAPAGTVYFSTDGSDPRLEGGAIAPNAIVYAGPITISGDVELRTRALDGGAWSAINEALFVLDGRVPAGPSNLIITEIAYNPDGDDAYEFIEFKNLFPFSTIDLSGVTLSNTVSFAFPEFTGIPPGGHLLVVEDATRFAERYADPASPWFYSPLVVAGAWTGALGNDGGRISVLDQHGAVIVEVDYEDSGDWPSRADGNGSSLELVNPDAIPANWHAGDAWRPSSEYHGSPGRDGSGAGPVILNEILTHSGLGDDWIELHNPGSEDVDVGHWYLSDSLDEPFKYQFAATNIIPAGGFLVVPEAAFNTPGGAGVQTPFALGRGGEEVLLCEASGTNLARIVDRFDFGAADLEVTFGIYERSDGEIDYPALRQPTPGAANSLPRVGPVVISEVMYHPSNGFEFVELSNLGGAGQTLFDPEQPTNTWRLSGAVAFSFPTNITFDACAKIIVCATNPSIFASQYGPLDAQVFGPWSGALNNAGDVLRLQKPGLPELDGKVPYILVDEIGYRPAAPWPAGADGSGPSLERISHAAYGNDPANWAASALNGGNPGDGDGNAPPVLNVATSQHLVADTALDLALSANDPDGPWQELHYTLDSPLPPGASFDATNAVFRWTPSPGSAGLSTQLVFRVSDAACASGSHSVPVQFTVHAAEAPFALAEAPEHPTEQVIRWSTIPGQVYEIEYTGDLNTGDWELLATVTASALQTTFTDVEDDTPERRYYRIRWLR